MEKFRYALTFSIVACCALVVWFAFCQPEDDYATLAANPTAIWFEKDSLPLGTVKYGTQHEAVFRFVNIGTTPLLISNVVPSCGCTSVKWSKHPVKPGSSGEIRTTYDPNSLGKFIKDLAVHCNVPEKTVHLKIYGKVTE